MNRCHFSTFQAMYIENVVGILESLPNVIEPEGLFHFRKAQELYYELMYIEALAYFNFEKVAFLQDELESLEEVDLECKLVLSTL